MARHPHLIELLALMARAMEGAPLTVSSRELREEGAEVFERYIEALPDGNEDDE